MNKNIKKKRLIILITILMICLGVMLLINYYGKKVDEELLESNLKIINDECNSIYENMDDCEEKYKSLLEVEEDPFKRGMYSSVLVQYYSAKNNYEEYKKYGYQAVENYNKVENGEYYSIAEQKYLAWSMLRLGKYSDSFIITNQLLDFLNSSGDEILTEEEVVDLESVIYSIFICLYSQFNILDTAEIYYDKLCQLDITSAVEKSKGDRIAYSKMIYADKINDLELRKQYAEECYQISLNRDKENSIEIADSVILNLASANTKLGNLEEALEQIKKSEEFFSKMGDAEGMANTYVAYAEYYDALNKNDLVQEYYNRAIEIYSETKNYYNLKYTTYELIKFLEANNLNNNINHYYKLYYNISNNLGGGEDINDLLMEITNTNDELNKIRVVLLEEESKTNKRTIIMGSVVIIILAVMIIRMYSLIKKKNQSEKRLEELVNTDYLTGLNTRGYGERLILNEINKNTKLAIAVIDIDNFKSVNDNYGHLFGDVLLKRIATELKENLDKNDIIARFGGEEFLVALKNKDNEEAKENLDNIRKIVNNTIFENDIQVSFSAGIKEWDGTSIDLVIKKADELLYKAKREGKNRVFN